MRNRRATVGFNMANIPPMLAPRGQITDIRYDGTEGELYNLREDPMQWRNLWNDPAYAKLKSDLRADLYDNLRPSATPNSPSKPPRERAIRAKGESRLFPHLAPSVDEKGDSER